MSLNEADTRSILIDPALTQSHWESDQIRREVSFTDGRIIVASGKVRRGEQKKADFILRYTLDFPIAVIEAKAEDKPAGDGVQQAREYAQILGLKFAYASNGHEIIEIDFTTGLEKRIPHFPRPDELWERLTAYEGLSVKLADQWLTPSYRLGGKPLRYYQEIAVNFTIRTVLQGQSRILLTMATGTGKTLVAFQICWKLWSAKWNREGKPNLKPRVLYLADRNILVDDPKDKTFIPFEDARWKIESGKDISRGREMYFAIYQALQAREGKSGVYEQYPPDFFDLIIIDECHRGSARDDSNWRDILDYFEPAYKIGMTATPLRDDNRDTYEYFGNPIYQYSLRDGIEDGFLAPYRLHRVLTNVDADGWRPTPGERDRYGREIPDEDYNTTDFERLIVLRARSKVIASHLTNYLNQTDPFSKTIVFCVDQEHADELRRQLHNLRTGEARNFEDYVCRITSDEGKIGKGFLSKFQDPEQDIPVIVTTSKLLTTGVDVPTCKNIVIATVIRSMTEFKQIIGRGTRLRTDFGKEYFTILDYTGSATTLFQDIDFDGYPAHLTEEEISADGETLAREDTEGTPPDGVYFEQPILRDRGELERRKFYVDGGSVEISFHVVSELDLDGNLLRTVAFTDYTADKVRSLYPNAAAIRAHWADPELRAEIIQQLTARGINFEDLADAIKQPDADPFDLLCHVAFNGALRTRRERAERLRLEETGFWKSYSPEAREILDQLLEKYTEHILPQFQVPEILKVAPLSDYGNLFEIAAYFGGVDQLKQAVYDLQALLYAA